MPLRKGETTTTKPPPNAADWKAGVYKPILEGAKTEVKRQIALKMRDALAAAVMKTIV